MSARQLKRLELLHAKKATDGQGVDEGKESGSEDEELETKPANNASAAVGYAFLMDSDSESDSEAEIEAHTRADSDSVPRRETMVTQVQDESAMKSASSRKKKKQNQKKKKKGKANLAAHAASDDEDRGESDEEVEKLLDELVAEAKDLSTDVVQSRREQAENALLRVQLNFINADKEMKRIFGVKENRGPRRAMDPRTNSRKATKRVFMVTPNDEWPRPPTFVAGGVRWTRANRPNGPGWSSTCHYYEVSWSSAYKKAHTEFEICQQTHDPNVIGLFLRKYPYHIDALLQMSEVFQHHGQMDHASDCIKMCIYALELAWSDQFDVASGNCRMDFYHDHNDGFFRALFLYMKQVGRRGCTRSAFELAKLILSLDPLGDPMSVLLAIDYYALSSRQLDFLIELERARFQAFDRSVQNSQTATGSSRRASSSTDSATINDLPNLQFSYALAQHLKGNHNDAIDRLAQSLLKFPTLLRPLLEKCGVNTSSTEWASVLGNRVFANASVVKDDLVQHLLDIYVSRNHTLWKVNDVQQFLLEGANKAVNCPMAQRASALQVQQLPAALQKYKRALESDYSDEITTLPADHPMMQPRQMPDHLDEEALLAIAQAQDQAQAGNLPADANPLLLFLQTLLPWNQVQGARQQGNGGPNPPGM